MRVISSSVYVYKLEMNKCRATMRGHRHIGRVIRRRRSALLESDKNFHRQRSSASVCDVLPPPPAFTSRPLNSASRFETHTHTHTRVSGPFYEAILATTADARYTRRE